MPSVTLINGTEVDSASPEWRAECLARQRHCDNLARLNRQQRNDYIDNVQRKEGAESARRVRAEFVRQWDERHKDKA